MWAQYMSSAGHLIGNSSLLDPCSQRLELRVVASLPTPKTCYKHSIVLLSKMQEDGVHLLSLWAQYEPSSAGHYYIGNYSSLLDPSNQIKDPRAVATLHYTMLENRMKVLMNNNCEFK
jgi:hypothetical protein